MQHKQDTWREANGCRGGDLVYKGHENGQCASWKCDAPTVFCLVDGGRDWPNSSPRDLELPTCAVKPADFPFAETIWDFFKQQKGRPQ